MKRFLFFNWYYKVCNLSLHSNNLQKSDIFNLGISFLVEISKTQCLLSRIEGYVSFLFYLLSVYFDILETSWCLRSRYRAFTKGFLVNVSSLKVRYIGRVICQM